MAIPLHSTKKLKTDGLKITVFGPAKSGKTRLIATMPNPVILSSESGLATLNSDEFPELPYAVIESPQQAMELCQWALTSDECKQFDSVAIDSLTDIADMCLAFAKANNRDQRTAYREAGDQITKFMRMIRDSKGKHVYLVTGMDESEDEMGHKKYAPQAPSAKIAQKIPYIFDAVLALRVEELNGQRAEALMCRTDGRWNVGVRSNKLEQFEPADLGAIIKKVTG